jgi:hypothetical protein
MNRNIVKKHPNPEGVELSVLHLLFMLVPERDRFRIGVKTTFADTLEFLQSWAKVRLLGTGLSNIRYYHSQAAWLQKTTPPLSSPPALHFGGQAHLGRKTYSCKID